MGRTLVERLKVDADLYKFLSTDLTDAIAALETVQGAVRAILASDNVMGTDDCDQLAIIITALEMGENADDLALATSAIGRDYVQSGGDGEHG